MQEIGSYDDSALSRIEPCDAIVLEVGRLFPPRTAEARADELDQDGD